MTHSSTVNRRQFLQQASCAALGATGVLSTILNLQMTNNVAAQTEMDDYKALVCIFLAGGNDSYNMLVPTNDADYQQYQAVRGSVALPRSGADSLLPLQVQGSNGRQFAVHPALSSLQGLFNAGNLTFVSNVGTLVEPTTVQQYKNKSVKLPAALFSHSDQISQWQTVFPQGASPGGWAGRMADVLLDASVQDSPISMNISLSGNNIMQIGGQTTFYTLGKNGAVSLTGKNSGSRSFNYIRYSLVAGNDDDDVNSLIGQAYQNLFEQAYIDEFKGSVEKDRFFSDSFDKAGETLDFSHYPAENDLADKLKTVAQTIAARDDLQMKRQVFFVLVGGWDHHQELLGTQHVLLSMIDGALSAFWQTLGDMGVRENVLTFTSSDFGRTLRSNGRGTDHAWGGNHFIMGGNSQLSGQRIHGAYPTAGEMSLGQGLDVGKNGRMLPTTSVDEYLAELALWFGVEPSALTTVFPNLDNFYNVGSEALPVGFLRNFNALLDQQVYLPMVRNQ